LCGQTSSIVLPWDPRGQPDERKHRRAQSSINTVPIIIFVIIIASSRTVYMKGRWVLCTQRHKQSIRYLSATFEPLFKWPEAPLMLLSISG
jgi:hypothetical protein